jgi:DNA-binding NarL/FixJ family response regulator
VAAEHLSQAREAYAERRWDACRDLLREADGAEPLAHEDLLRLAFSLHLLGDDAGTREVFERAHQTAVVEGRWREAAQAAIWYGFVLDTLGERARSSGWATRARGLALDHGLDGVEPALLDAEEAHGLLLAGRVAEARELAAVAARTGKELGDANVEVLGGLTVGYALLHEGRREEALACLDDVMVTVSTQPLQPPVAGVAYCAVIGTCMNLLDLPRAQEWTSVLSDWCDSQSGLVPFRGQCLVHRSQIKTMHGDWAGALEEARRACERLDRTAAGDAWYQVGEIHRMRGDWEQAEAAYRQANSHGRQPEPGLALMRLAQGRLETATATFRRLYAETGRVDRVDVLAGFVEAMVAGGELDAAQAAVEELDAVDGSTPVHRGRAAEARGLLELTRADPAAALAPLRTALGVWSQLGMRHDAARVRARIGDACRALGDEASAALEHEAARETFRELGARPDLERLERQRSPLGGLTAREVEVLRQVAAGHTNRQIAADLFLSEKTVARHLSNIYTKLGLRSRSAATAYAYDHHLV